MMTPIFMQATAPQGAGWMNIVMIVAVIAVFYFFMIRPQQKKQKALEEQRNALKAGDRIVTSGGIYGTIKHVNERDFVIEIAEGVRISVDKSSVFALADTAKK